MGAVILTKIHSIVRFVHLLLKYQVHFSCTLRKFKLATGNGNDRVSAAWPASIFK